MTITHWAPVYFSKAHMNVGEQNLLAMEQTMLDVFLDSKYMVATSIESISPEVLEDKLVNDWHDYITGMDDGEKKTRIWHIANKFFDEFQLSEVDKAEESPVKGNYLNKVEHLLKIKKPEEEKRLNVAIYEYVKCKGTVGIVGIVGIEQFNNSRILRIIEVLDNKMDLRKTFWEIKKKYNGRIIKENGKDYDLEQLISSTAQCNFVKHLFAKMLIEKEDGYGIKEVYEIVRSDRYRKKYSGNANLGIEELKCVFLKHESVRYYDSERKMSTEKLDFYSAEEIGQFLADYYRLVREIESDNFIDDLKEEFSGLKEKNDLGTTRKRKTKKGFGERVASLRATEEESNEMMAGILNCVLDDSERIQFKRLMKERELAVARDIVRLQTKDQYKGISFLFSYSDNTDLALFHKSLPVRLRGYHKMRTISMITEQNLRDLLLWIDREKDVPVATMVERLTKVTQHYANPFVSCCYIPLTTGNVQTIHEAYAKALRRSVLQSKLSKYEKIWTSLTSNFLKEIDGVVTLTANIKKIKPEEYNQIVGIDRCGRNKGKWITETDLYELLNGESGRDTNIKSKFSAIKRTAKWLNSTGMYNFDVNRVGDFKIIYDLLFTYKMDETLKNENFPISIRNLKGEVDSTEELTLEEQAYLLLGAFISKLYNRQDVSMEDFMSICLNVQKAIHLHSEIMENVNEDFILIQVNAFRMAGKATLKEYYREFSV